MARPKKEGLDYFPLDVHIFEDEKIEAISGEFGIKGELAVIKLLCAVYEKGYFIVWNELTKAKLLKRLPNTSKELLEQIVNRLVAWGFFNESLFNSAKVLTSSKIQATFLEATKRRKTRKPTLHWINADNNLVEEGVNVYINPQSKVKESKVNKSKEDNNKKSELSSLSIHDYFQNNIGPENPAIIEGLEMWKDDLGEEVVKKAIEITALGDTRTFNYVQGILRNWVYRNLTTIDLINAAEQQRKAKNKRRQNTGRKEILPDWVDKTDQELERNEPKESDPELAKQADAIKERLRQQRKERQV
ncbi:Lin1244/Lin1753 domain-containing protein [Listeria aquatica]|uniref:Lin1244/Lin1753 domain-containing protein n=1 Tax=Listeria aquatica TaxID=1494960 RepID=UPI003EF370A6